VHNAAATSAGQSSGVKCPPGTSVNVARSMSASGTNQAQPSLLPGICGEHFAQTFIVSYDREALDIQCVEKLADPPGLAGHVNPQAAGRVDGPIADSARDVLGPVRPKRSSTLRAPEPRANKKPTSRPKSLNYDIR